MKFELKIKCENAAFADQPEIETARLLRQTADRVEGMLMRDGVLVEYNGNRCGDWFFEYGDDDDT